MDPEVRFATTADGVSIAYCVAGHGPPLLVLPGLPISHLQAEWQIEGFRSFLERLGEYRTVIRYDARGLGLSDRNCANFSLEGQLLDVLAVLEKLGIEKCSAFAASYAGPIGITFAARYPERIERLVLWCTHSSFKDVATEVSDDQSRQREAVIGLARIDPSLGVHTYVHHAMGWGPDDDTNGVTVAAMKSIELAEFFPRLGTYEGFDARPCLNEVKAPTLVLHRPAFHGSHVNVARRLAARVSDARLLLLEGESVVPFAGDVDAVIKGITDFLGHEESGVAPLAELPASASSTPDAMRAVLFTDIEGHTEFMQRLRDDKGRELLRQHEKLTRAALRAHGGTEVKTMGDGFMASFGSAQKALECAAALQRAFATRDGEPLRVRIGINAGEPIAEDDDLFGASVIVAARIAATAAGGQTLVSDVVRQLVAGKGFLFSDTGEHVLKGMEEPVRIWELRCEAEPIGLSQRLPRSRP